MRDELQTLNIIMTGTLREKYTVIVPFSGGKDSQSCLKLACQEYGEDNVLALFCDTGYEHTITYKHVQDTVKKYRCDLVTLSAGTVKDLCIKNGRLPHALSRFCTSKLKIRPTKFFLRELSKKQSSVSVWYGMRSDESPARARKYERLLDTDNYAPHDINAEYPKYLEKQGVSFRLPINRWSQQEVFRYLKGEENPLYSMGFSRVGCFPCLAASERYKRLAFNFDEVGARHFRVMQEITNNLNYRPPLFEFEGQGGAGCSVCSI